MHHLKISGSEAVALPKTAKMWINRNLAMGVDNCDEIKPTQEWTIRESGQTLTCKFVKFQKVYTLTIFVAGNQEDKDITVIDSIQLFGDM